MARLVLVIGNKNYSSWSLRPWLLLRHHDIPFSEVRIPLYRESSTDEVKIYSPTGLVPVLKHGDITVWDSLAICEYIAELHPEINAWPAKADVRAVARAVSAEMHAGFSAFRHALPMNVRKRFDRKPVSGEVERDIRRICEIWEFCRRRYGRKGPWLFGEFSIADAMYAPVALRFQTYSVPLTATDRQYVDTLLALPALKEWCEAAVREREVIERYEIER